MEGAARLALPEATRAVSRGDRAERTHELEQVEPQRVRKSPEGTRIVDLHEAKDTFGFPGCQTRLWFLV